MSRAPQHFTSSKKQATCDGCSVHQCTCSVISHHSGISRAVHPQLSMVDVNHWHILVRAPIPLFTFCGKLIESCEDDGMCGPTVASIASVWQLFFVCDRMPPSATGSTWWERSTQRSSTVGESCLPHLHRTVTDWLHCWPSPWLILLRPCWWHGNEILLGQCECFDVCTCGGMCILAVTGMYVCIYVVCVWQVLWTVNENFCCKIW